MSHSQEMQTFSTNPQHAYPIPGVLAGPPAQYIPENATTIAPQFYYYPDPSQTPQPAPYLQTNSYGPNFQPNVAPRGVEPDSHVVGLDNETTNGPVATTRIVYSDDIDASYTQSDADRDTVLSWILFALGWFFCCTWWAGIWFTRSKDPRARVGGFMSLGAAIMWILIFIYSIRQGTYTTYNPPYASYNGGSPVQFLSPAAALAN